MELTLVFDTKKETKDYDVAKTFSILYQALRFGRITQREAPGMDVIRSEARLRRVFDSISHDEGQGDTKTRELNPEGGSITLRSEDYERLRDYLEKKVAWNADSAISVVEAADFLILAKESV